MDLEQNINSSILVTGCAGFIGAALSAKLVELDFDVVGIDNLSNYYDINLKKDRLNLIQNKKSKNANNWHFLELDICDKDSLFQCFRKFNLKL